MHLTGIVGLAVMLGLAWLFSTNRRAIRLKTVAWGLGLQFVLAVLVLKVEFGRRVFEVAGDGVKWLLNFSYEGARFVFGPLADRPTPVAVHNLAAEKATGALTFVLPETSSSSRSGAADDHLHRRVLRHPVSHRSDAVHRQAAARRDD